MGTAAQSKLPRSRLPDHWTLADLQKHLRGIPLERIRLYPPPGYATGEDVIAIAAREDRLCELEDGVLVEKPMGWYESILAALILGRLYEYLKGHDLGQVLGADGSLEILPDQVKIPDVCFISWRRFPRKELPRRPIPSLVPDFVVEVLSETNTPEEMDDKLEKYFRAGVHLVWYIDPEARSARTYTGKASMVEIDEGGVLDGGEVLPGFRIPLRELFEEADRRGPKE
jgi:Uma2 family endonuclease